MLNRRILRIKAFKVLYAYAENPDLSLKEVLESLETSAEATRDLYLYMLAVIPALTQEAARRIEAARGKFNPTEEELHPNLRFVSNGISALLENDPDFQRLIENAKKPHSHRANPQRYQLSADYRAQDTQHLNTSKDAHCLENQSRHASMRLASSHFYSVISFQLSVFS